MIIISSSEQETQKIAHELSKKLRTGVVCLYGELGSGKTTFMRGLAKGLGITSRVQSPTFTYQRVHTGKNAKLYHFDCYRINPENKNDFIMNDIYDALEKNDGVIAIEWAQNVRSALPEVRTDIFFEYHDDEKRKISIRPREQS